MIMMMMVRFMMMMKMMVVVMKIMMKMRTHLKRLVWCSEVGRFACILS